MKKIKLALPALTAALLITSACAKTDDAANNVAVSDVTTNDIVANDIGANDTSGLDGNLTGTEPLVENDTAPENTSGALDNGQ